MKSNVAARLIPILGLFIVVSMTSCDIDNPCGVGCTDYSVREPFEYEVTFENQDSIKIYGINGSIDITGTTDNTLISIWGEKIVKSDGIADAEAHLDDLKVRVESNRNEVTVRTDQPRGSHGLSYEVVYHVRIPSSLQVKIENINGKIEVDSVSSDVNIGLTNGDVHITDIWGNVDVDVTNGGIFGDLTLPLRGICQMTLVNGKIDLSIHKNTSAEFSANVTNGNIHISDLVLSNQNTTKHSVTGTLGNGSGTITLRLVNGQIYVSGLKIEY